MISNSHQNTYISICICSLEANDIYLYYIRSHFLPFCFVVYTVLSLFVFNLTTIRESEQFWKRTIIKGSYFLYDDDYIEIKYILVDIRHSSIRICETKWLPKFYVHTLMLLISLYNFAAFLLSPSITRNWFLSDLNNL